MKYLYINGNENNIRLVEIEDIISNLIYFSVSENTLKTISDCNSNKITALRLTGSGLTEIPDLSKFIKLTKLTIYNNPKIANIDNISKIVNLENLELTNTNLHERMINFSNLNNLIYLDLRNNRLWSEDLENLKALKNNINLTIDLSNNSIIDATALLELDSSTKINLSNNVNLSQESKDKLKAKFGNNVMF
mgnify:CR=1 FL=1